MSDSDLFEQPTLSSLALHFELHPFEAARILSLDAPLPGELRFGDADAERLRQLGGLEQWWEEDSLAGLEDAEMLQHLAARLLGRALAGGESTRLDNLSRGLRPEDRVRVDGIARRLLQRRALVARPTSAGMHVWVAEGGAVERLANGEKAEDVLSGFWESASRVVKLTLS